MPAGIVERLRCGTHCEDDEVVDLPLLFGLHPLIGVESAVGTVAAWDLSRDLAGDVRDLELFDAPDPALAGEQSLPSRFNAARERRHHAKPCDDDASHHRHSWKQLQANLTVSTLSAKQLSAHNVVRISQARSHFL